MRRLVIAMAVVLALSAPAARAATISVTTTSDALLADGQCSLREAITSANLDAATFGCAAGSGADTVVLPAGTFELGIAGGGENANAGGDLDVLGALTLVGTGQAATTIDAKGIDRAIDVRPAVTATIRGLTVTGGRAPNGGPGTDVVLGNPATGSDNGQTATAGNAGGGESGGGIRNEGTLTILDSAVVENVAGAGGRGGIATGQGGGTPVSTGSGGSGGDAHGGQGGVGGRGGGIYNAGSLTLAGVTVAGNVAGGGGVGGTATGGQGGGGTTLAGGAGGNAFAGAGGSGGGGGGVVTEAAAAETTIDRSTIRGNIAGLGGAGGLGQGSGGGPGQTAGGAAGNGFGGGGGVGGSGGGVSLSGTATVTRTLFTGNASGDGRFGGTGTGGIGGFLPNGGASAGKGGNGTGGPGGGGGSGAAALSVTAGYSDVTFDANSTGDGGQGGLGVGGKGGAVATTGTPGNGGDGKAGGGGGGGVGAALIAFNTTTLTHATITSNALAGTSFAGSAVGGQAGGGSASPGNAIGGNPGPAGVAGAIFRIGTTTLRNSIIAGNGTPACYNPVLDGGHNISFTDASCPGAGSDPLLAPLADNGGPTQTRRPLGGSPAIDAVPTAGAGCTATDQRGAARPGGAGCEIGAYEIAPPVVAIAPPDPVTNGGGTLRGQVNPNARATSYHFEYGLSTSYGTSTPAADLPGGVDAVPVSAAIGGFAPGTTLHARLVANNADGSSPSADITFTTGSLDETAPAFLSASMRPRRFAVNRRGRAEKPVTARVRRGTTIRFRLSEAGRVLFTVQRAAPGRKVGRACRKPTRRNRTKRRCTRWVQPRRFAMNAAAGANRKRFSGRIGRRSLRPGRHRVTLTATDAAGNRSATRRLRFRVLRAR